MTEPSHLTATRAAYDDMADRYAEFIKTDLVDKPLDRGMLAAFVELVGTGPVADLGCGTGRLTAYLNSEGVSAFGVDLSPGMVAEARRLYPGLRFDVGSLTGSNLEDGSLDGVLAWYSIIYTPPELLAEVFAEFHRVLAPGGHVALAFKAGDERRRIRRPDRRKVTFDEYLLEPGHVAELMADAGLRVTARLVREPGAGEEEPQAYLFAEKR
jgi:SAM-dependent methyltransferase